MNLFRCNQRACCHPIAPLRGVLVRETEPVRYSALAPDATPVAPETTASTFRPASRCTDIQYPPFVPSR